MYQFRRSVLLFSTLFVGIGIGLASSTTLIMISIVMAIASFIYFEEEAYDKKMQKK